MNPLNRTPVVLCAPDKFRDALTAREAANALAAGAEQAGWEALTHPLADGGEGSLEAVITSGGGTTEAVDSVDPLGRPIRTRVGWLPGRTAVVEAAEVIGLAGLAPADRDPLRASSAGLAAPILAAVAGGARRVVVFLGGTATVDGGTGLLTALGARLSGESGTAIAGSGADLARIARADLEPARRALHGVELVVATDVRSPFHGPDGAAFVYGPQKGADPAAVERLDAGLRRFAPLLGNAAELRGAGAAGGLGAALTAIGKRPPVLGAEMVLDLTGFAARLAGVDLCLSGEGRIDRSTAAGKTPHAVLLAAERAGVPCALIGGTVTAEAEELYAHHAAGVFAAGRLPRPLAEALPATAGDLATTARAVCSLAAAFRPVRGAVAGTGTGTGAFAGTGAGAVSGPLEPARITGP
ncbi:glycerate kinase [Streptomyces sp. CAU 1734]|uniref:glycerate kinase family protein n=1 Tax=Streptomyces sp. CAU 1734 TaxID=3140360 RepID=UPI003260BE19